MVGFRKAMDYFPSVFSQKELYWLDNLMPASNKKEKKGKKKNKKNHENSGTELVIILIELHVKQLVFCFRKNSRLQMEQRRRLILKDPFIVI